MGLLDSIFGGSSQKSSSKTDPATVWGTQSPYLAGLYQRAQNASLGQGSGGYGPAQSMYQPPIQQQISNGQRAYGYGGAAHGAMSRQQQQAPAPMQQPGMDGYDPLSGLGQALTGQGMGMLNQLGMLGQIGNPFVQAQIGQLGQGLGRMYQDYIAPTINSQFTGGGSLGGSRQGLALGQAATGLGQQFTTGAIDLLGNSTNTALQANQVGLGGLGNVFGAGNAGVFGSLPGLASLIGNPTVLSGGGSSSGSGSSSNGIMSMFSPIKLF